MNLLTAVVTSLKLLLRLRFEDALLLLESRLTHLTLEDSGLPRAGRRAQSLQGQHVLGAGELLLRLLLDGSSLTPLNRLEAELAVDAAAALQGQLFGLPGGGDGRAHGAVVGQQALLLMLLLLRRHHHVVLGAFLNRLLGAFLILNVLAFRGGHGPAVGRVLDLAAHLGRHLSLFGVDEVGVGDAFAFLARDFRHFEVDLTRNQFAFSPRNGLASFISGPHLRQHCK